MKQLQISILLCVVAFGTGCPSKPSSSFTNKDTFVSNVNDFLTREQADYNAVIHTDKNEAKRIRNDAIESALAVVDDNYTDFISHIETRRSRGDFLLDVIELGTGAATGIVKGERPNQILGIALTAFRGGRTSRELNFYKQQTTPILISKMDGNRANVLITILDGKSKDVDQYSLKTAIRDLVAYNNAGTLVRAFTELSKDTAVQTKESEDKVLVLKGVKLTPEATQAQRDFSFLANSILETLRDDLKDPAKAASATTKLQNIVKALEADADLGPVLTAAGVSSADIDGAKLRNKLRAIRGEAADKSNTARVDKINQAIVDNGR